MMSCPVCNKAVDPLRARHVRVVGVKVISYCSAECFQASAPAAAASSSGQGAAAAGSVERKLEDAARTPASGEGKSASASSAVASVEQKKGEPRGNGKADAKSDPKKGDAKAVEKNDKTGGKGAAADAKPEATPGKGDGEGAKAAAGEAKPGAKPEPQAGKPEPQAGKPEGKPESKGKPDGKPESKPAAKSEAKSDGKPEPKAGGKPEPKAGGKPESKPEPEPKAGAKGEPRSGGKSEGKASDKPGVGEAAAPGAAATSAEPAGPRAAGATEPAEAVEPAPRARSGRALVLGALAAAAIAGAVWWTTRPDPAKPVPPPPPVAPPVVEAPPPPPVIAPAEAHARAVEVLRAHFAVESLRVRRVAAAALGRQADAQAIAVLADLLPTEQSEIARLDIGYGLARAKDPRGLELLLTGLRSSRRDVKGEAARLLAALRDPRAASTLSSLSNLQQFRLSATEQLARLGNKQAVERLEKLRADPQASEEDRRRATIAIGDAGGAHVAPELRELLGDQRFNVKAAAALAALRDASCRPLLLEHLTIPSLRVDAALALRRLEPELDASTFLYRLMPALESAKDTERVEAAEAILVLTGPAGVAELD